MRIFLDANILFSGGIPGSLLSQFLHELRHHAVFLTNIYAKTEAERNLSAKFPKGLVGFHKIVSLTEILPLTLFELTVVIAEKDRPILCGAISAKADFLLTGDKKDFGLFFGQTIDGVKVVTVELLIRELVSSGILSNEKAGWHS